VQWRGNGRLQNDVIALEKTRMEQATKIDEQAKAIKGYLADLDELRERLRISEAALREAETKLAKMTDERDQLVAERDGLRADQEQLKATLAKWVEAVKARDELVKQAGEQVHKLAEERNEAVRAGLMTWRRSTMRW